MLITNTINCFIPVVNNKRDIDLNYFYNLEELPKEYWYRENSNFSLPLREYIKVDNTISDMSLLLNRVFISLNTNTKGTVLSAEIINEDLILLIEYKFIPYFLRNELVVSQALSIEYPEIVLKILEKYFKKPEVLIYSKNDEKFLNILRNNDSFTIQEFKKIKYPHNDYIVLIKNNFTKKSKIVFYQKSNNIIVSLN